MKLAIVIPYRDRYEDLCTLKKPLKDSLNGIDFKIIVSEQADSKPFNRGLSNNVGMSYAISNRFTHVVTHDVDSIPLYADYSPCEHIARLCGIYNGKCTPPGNLGPYLGGIVMMSVKAMKETDGYPNSIFGWGHEDDVLRTRAYHKKIDIEYRCGFYKVRDHQRDQSRFWENGIYIANNYAKLGGLSNIDNFCSYSSSKDEFGIRLKFKCKDVEV